MVRSFFDSNMIKQLIPQQSFGSASAFDFQKIFETQRKNVEAATELMQLSMAGLQQAVTRQAELVGKMVQDNSSYASAIMTDGTPEQKVQRQTDLVRKSYEATIAGAREVNEILSKSNEEAADIIKRRVAATLSEFKSAFDPKGYTQDNNDVTPSAKKTTSKRNAA